MANFFIRKTVMKYQKVKRVFILLIVLVIPFGYSQTNDSIQLPAGDLVMRIDSPVLFYDLYVTKDQKVYFGTKRLRFYDEIYAAIMDAYRQNTVNAPVKIVLHADVTFIDKIKEEIGRTGFNRIYYKTGSLEDLTFEVNWHHGSTLPDQSMDRILTVQEEAELNEILGQIPEAPPEADNFLVLKSLYRGTKEEIENWLQKYSFRTLKLIGNTKYSFQGQILDYTNESELEEILLGPDHLLILFDEALTYGDYVKFIQIKNELAIKSQLRKIIGEIPLKAEKRLRMMGIILN